MKCGLCKKDKEKDKYKVCYTCRERQKKYYYDNKSKRLDYQNKYNSLEEVKEKKISYDKSRAPMRRNRVRARILVDENFKLRRNLRCRVVMAMKRKTNGSMTNDLIGCDIFYFRNYIEKQFKEGMFWDNHGKCDGWEIDHIIPVNNFNLIDESQQRKCFHYTNLQPLWKKGNLKKGYKC